MDKQLPEQSPDAPTPAEGSTPVRRRMRVNRASGAVAGLIAAVLIVAATAGVRWWTSPTLFAEGGPGGFSASPKPLKEAALYVGIAFPKAHAASEEITFSSARAHLTPGSAEARTSFSVCRSRHLKGTYGTSTTERPDVYCSQVRPLTQGATMTLNSDFDQYVVLTITPKQRGTVKLTAIDLIYTRGWDHLHQHGTQHLPQSIELEAT